MLFNSIHPREDSELNTMICYFMSLPGDGMNKKPPGHGGFDDIIAKKKLRTS
jgi:hypothetical protein